MTIERHRFQCPRQSLYNVWIYTYFYARQMITTQQLIGLFKAIASGDSVSARTKALAICDYQENKGNRKAAKSLRLALKSSDNLQADSRTTVFDRDLVNSSSDDIFHLGLLRLEKLNSLSDVQLSQSSKNELFRIVQEWQHKSELSKHGVGRRSKLIFHGPPRLWKNTNSYCSRQ